MRAPVFEGDEEKTRSAEILNAILIATLLGALLSIPLLLIAPTTSAQMTRIGAWLVLVALAFGGLGIMRRGRVTLASAVTVIGIWLIATAAILIGGGGVRSLGFPGNIIFVVIAALLLGRRAAAWMAVLSILTGLLLVYWRATGWIAELPAPDSDTEIWLLQSVYTISAAILLGLALRLIDRAFARARHDLAERRQAEQTYRNIYENAVEGFFQSNLAGK
ncbi:MAG TPA: hypothetical protein VGJ22_07225, partial [Anaerolineales bacterium]